jgi:hypothetical protein
MKKLLAILAFLFFLLIPASAQDLPVNTPIDVTLEVDYSVYPEDVVAVSGSTTWNSEQFQYVDYTVGVFNEASFLFFGNELRVGVGEFKFAAAGAEPLPVPVVNPVFYTLHLVTKQVGDYTITHVFTINESQIDTSIRTGKIVDNTSNEELPIVNFSSVSVYPNPTSNNMTTLVFDSVYGGRADIVVSDTQGRVVSRLNTEIRTGRNEFRVNGNKGLNFVKVVGAGQVLTTKFINL